MVVKIVHQIKSFLLLTLENWFLGAREQEIYMLPFTDCIARIPSS